MSDLSIQINTKEAGIDRVRHRLIALREAMRLKIVRSALREAGGMIRRDMRAMAPRELGVLRRSIKVRVGSIRGQKNIQYAIVGPSRRVFERGRKPTKYAHLIEGGTKKHTIRPKRAKALAIPQTVTARSTVYSQTTGRRRKGKQVSLLNRRLVRSVRHPGTRPQPFIKPALDFNRGTVQALIQQRLTRAIAQQVRAA